MPDKVTLKIPRKLYQSLQPMILNTGFGSVTEFVVFLLREFLANRSADETDLNADEIKHIRQRLRNLGYL
jgi:Arc/MetJ-type ribon-helix-helix transcriptional regulator